MTKNQRLNALILVTVCAVLPTLAQTSITTSRALRPQPPYTVEFKSTHVQTLANGTTITTESKEVVARDQEMRHMSAITESPRSDRPAITNVHVNDPATGDEITWNSASKVARDVRRPVGTARQGCWATPDGHYKANYGNNFNGSAPMQPLQPLPLPADATAPVASPLAENDASSRVQSSGGGVGIGGSAAVTSSVPPGVSRGMLGGVLGSKTDSGNMVREDLGADTIMGVAVRGSRTTISTPAGAMGNDQPLVSTNQIWMAPSLGLVLRSTSDDPRMGKTNREVVSLDLNNPDPELFQPPAGYELVTEEMQPVACPQ